MEKRREEDKSMCGPCEKKERNQRSVLQYGHMYRSPSVSHTVIQNEKRETKRKQGAAKTFTTKEYSDLFLAVLLRRHVICFGPARLDFRMRRPRAEAFGDALS